MERFGPKENVMSGEKNENTATYDDFGYSMFGLVHEWRHEIMYAGYITKTRLYNFDPL